MRLHAALRVVWMAVAAAVVIGTVGGALVSQYYWGYAFARPAPPHAVAAAEKVVGIAELRSIGSERRCSLAANPTSSGAVAERIRIARPYVEELPGVRMMVALADRGLRPQAAPSDASVSGADVYDQLSAAGLIAKGDPGYDTRGCVGGYAIVVDTSAGRRLLVEVGGLEVSNDHHQWSEAEFVYAGDRWRLEKGRLFFYDVAGLEGAEWPRLHGLFALLALPFALAFAAACMPHRTSVIDAPFAADPSAMGHRSRQ